MIENGILAVAVIHQSYDSFEFDGEPVYDSFTPMVRPFKSSLGLL